MLFSLLARCYLAAMAEIVNLRRVRKAKARDAEAARAADNRVLHGRTRAEREAGTTARESLSRTLDGARLDPSSDGDGEPRE